MSDLHAHDTYDIEDEAPESEIEELDEEDQEGYTTGGGFTTGMHTYHYHC